MAKISVFTIGSKHGVFEVIELVPIHLRKTRHISEIVMKCNYGTLHTRQVGSLSTSTIAKKRCQTCYRLDPNKKIHDNKSTIDKAVEFVNQERNK